MWELEGEKKTPPKVFWFTVVGMITSFAPSCKTARQEQQRIIPPWGKNARTPTQHLYPIITYFSTGLCWHQSPPDLLAALLLNQKVQLNAFYSPTSGISSLLLPEFFFLFFLEFFHSGILHRDPYAILHLFSWNSPYDHPFHPLSFLCTSFWRNSCWSLHFPLQNVLLRLLPLLHGVS